MTAAWATTIHTRRVLIYDRGASLIVQDVKQPASVRVAAARDMTKGPELLSYCTGCLHYQMGDLATVMAMWAQHLEDVGVNREDS